MKGHFVRLLTAVAVVLACPVFAEEQDGAGDQFKEEYIQHSVPPNTAVRIMNLPIPAGGEIKPHCHSGDEIGIVAEGTLMLKVGDGKYEMKRPGELFKVPPRTWMTVKNETNQAARLYSVLVVDDDKQYLKHDDKNCRNK